MSNFNQSSEELSAKWSSLQAQWSQCRSTWSDVVADRFEHDFWSEWQSSLPQAIRVLQTLEEALARAEKDLEND